MNSSQNVYNILDKSPYKSLYKGYTFVFSSVRHKNKFDENINEFIAEQQSRYSWKLKCNEVKSYIVFALLYYKMIETRGFLVLDSHTGDLISSNYSIEITII